MKKKTIVHYKNFNTKKLVNMDKTKIIRYVFAHLFNERFGNISCYYDIFRQRYVVWFIGEEGEIIKFKARVSRKKKSLVWGNLKGRWRNDKRDTIISWKEAEKSITIKETFLEKSFVTSKFKI